MYVRTPRFISLGSLLACALFATAAGVAHAQAVIGELSDQKLDRIDVIERQGATNVALDIDSPAAVKPWVATDYTAVNGTAFTACQNTSTRGIYCLDGNVIRRWPEPERAASGSYNLFSCANPDFAFDRDNVCTAMTVDLAGSVWIAGKKKSRFSLFKLSPGACTASQISSGLWKNIPVLQPVPTDVSTYCAREYASGRPLLIDLSVVDGDVADAFPYGAGVIAVEERREVTFFPDQPLGTPTVIGSGRAWGLGGGEQLQAATLLQKPLPNNSRNWVLVTTSIGRLLSRDVPYPPTLPGAVINHTPAGGPINLVAATPPSCSATALTALYDVRTSVKTRATFVSDRRGCRLLSLKSNVDTVGSGSLAFTSQEVIASTSPGPNVATLTTAPEAVSIAPGIKVNLYADCGFVRDSFGNLVLDGNGNPIPKECGIVPDGPNDTETVKAAASLKGVKIDSTANGLTVFQIQNIADCRYLAYGTVGDCTPVLNTTTNVWSGAIVKPDGTVAAYPADYVERPAGSSIYYPRNPETLYLDVSKLMPPEVTKVTTLPRMLLSPRYRALSDTNFFDALFGITDEGVRFRETWLGKFELGDLIGFDRKLGCNVPPQTNPSTGQPTMDPVNGPPWDVIVTISERYTTVGGPVSGGRQHTDMLVNTYGCDPLDPPIAGARWSLYPYGLKLAAERLPDPLNPGQFVVRYPDSIFAKLVLSLFMDLGKTIDDYLCFDRDNGGGTPISSGACTGLKADWVNTEDKLRKCVESSTEPLNSTEIRACNAFEVQYAPFRDRVMGLALAPPATDPANRIGEVKARLEVFRYVYDEQFKPSIPDSGFVDGLYE